MNSADFRQSLRSAFVVTCTAGLEGEAREELRRALPQVEFGHLFMKGNLLLVSALEEAETVARVKSAATRCIATMSPIQVQFGLRRAKSDVVSAVVDAAEYLGQLKAGMTFRVLCRRRGRHEFHAHEIEREVALALEAGTGAQGDYTALTDRLVMVDIFQNVALLGVSSPANVIHKELRTTRKYRPGERPFNRAQQKMKEALNYFGISVREEDCVLDLGAAPGGWTAHLALSAKEVYAVDPADLAPVIEALPNVVHLRCKAEELPAKPELQEHFDLIANDMSITPAESACIMVKLAPLLKPGGRGIMTIKYVNSQRRRQEQQALAILDAAYEQIELRHLPHNRLEITAAMRRRKR